MNGCGLVYLTPLILPFARRLRRYSWRRLFAYTALTGAVLTLLGTLPHGTFGIREILVSLTVIETMLVLAAALSRKLSLPR
jgi:hypothetical protein